MDSVGACEVPAIVGTWERELADKLGQVHLLGFAVALVAPWTIDTTTGVGRIGNSTPNPRRHNTP